MGRPVILSNGQIMIGLDENGLVHDFYYPYIGLDNLTTAHSVHHKIGLSVDGKFSWVDDGSWKIDVNFEPDALVSNITMSSADLGVCITFKDFIDYQHNSLIRRIVITNQSNNNREIKLFMHQVFQISRAGRADTALYVPDGNYILDYKGRCAMLVYGQNDQGQPFDQYAVGNYAIEGKEGTFIDAEDGELSGNPVEHGGVDSVVRFKLNIAPNGSSSLDYWIIVAASQYDCEQVHNEYIQRTIDRREKLTRESWQQWLGISELKLSSIDKKYLDMTKKSLMVVKAHTDRRGSILASGDSSIFNFGRDYYCYCWPRDACYALWPLIKLGYKAEAKRFFEFSRDTINANGYMMHKYQPDRSIGSTWHPLIHDNRKELAIQEDETAIVVFMLGEFYDYCGEPEFVQGLYSNLVKPAADFMAKYIDEKTNLPHASYDIWEEKFLTTTYTTAVVESALRRASKFAEIFDYPEDGVAWLDAADKIKEASERFYCDKGYYQKGYHLSPDYTVNNDNTLDISSLFGVLTFSGVDKQSTYVKNTATAVEQILVNKQIGGVIRYENDRYITFADNQSPNPWIVCAMWLARYYIETAQPEKALGLIDWSLKHAYPSGVMSEQIDSRNDQPLGVAPLVWSHAEFINTVLDLAASNQ